jgi:hypothetical protein
MTKLQPLDAVIHYVQIRKNIDKNQCALAKKLRDVVFG